MMNLVVVVAATYVVATFAFLPSPTLSIHGVSKSQFIAGVQQLSAKKRRRRTNESNEIPKTQSDDLPEFDLDVESTNKNVEPSSSDTPFEITEAMKGKEKPVRSIKELVSDRSLEKAFQFDEPTGESLPDLTNLDITNTANAGKKKAKQEARRLAAMQAKEEENVDMLQNLPPMLKGEDGKFSPIKAVEAGTWAGIILLVVWEVYLNTPLFDRAAPLAPIVYQFLL